MFFHLCHPHGDEDIKPAKFTQNQTKTENWIILATKQIFLS